MKLAVTITTYVQVSQMDYADISKTKIFDSSDNFDVMLEWANNLKLGKFDIDHLKISEIVE